MKCVFCGIEFSREPLTKPACLRFSDTCWSCTGIALGLMGVGECMYRKTHSCVCRWCKKPFLAVTARAECCDDPRCFARQRAEQRRRQREKRKIGEAMAASTLPHSCSENTGGPVGPPVPPTLSSPREERPAAPLFRGGILGRESPLTVLASDEIASDQEEEQVVETSGVGDVSSKKNTACNVAQFQVVRIVGQKSPAVSQKPLECENGKPKPII